MAIAEQTGNDLSFRNLGMIYEAQSGSDVALEDFSLEVQSNEFITLVGLSGCGKSTLLQVTSGLQTPTSGDALLNGQGIAGPSPDKAMVFQSFSLFPWKPVQRIGVANGWMALIAAELVAGDGSSTGAGLLDTTRTTHAECRSVNCSNDCYWHNWCATRCGANSSKSLFSELDGTGVVN